MKVLFLTSRIPYPPHRGDKLRMFHLIRNLSRKHDITLLSFIADNDERRYIEPLSEFCREIHLVYRPVRVSLLGCISAIASSDPIQVGYFKSSAMKKELKKILEKDKFDLVHTHLIRMAHYTTELQGPLRVVDLTDAGSLYLERFRRTTRNPFMKLLLGAELGRLRRYERIIGAFDAALVCSPVDREVLAAVAPGARLELLYNSIDLNHFTPDDQRQPDPGRIIFTGNLSYFPNVDGIRYFVREILPLIRRDIPDVKLYIVGKDPPKKVRKLASEGIFVTGFVPDIRPEYLKSAVAVAPIRFGAGTLTKVLEPMALGIPVVSTPIGVEGLPFESGKHLMICEAPERFAAATVMILRDPDLRSRLAVNGRNIVRSNYGSETVAATLDQLYKDLLIART